MAKHSIFDGCSVKTLLNNLTEHPNAKIIGPLIVVPTLASPECWRGFGHVEEWSSVLPQQAWFFVSCILFHNTWRKKSQKEQSLSVVFAHLTPIFLLPQHENSAFFVATGKYRDEIIFNTKAQRTFQCRQSFYSRYQYISRSSPLAPCIPPTFTPIWSQSAFSVVWFRLTVRRQPTSRVGETLPWIRMRFVSVLRISWAISKPTPPSKTGTNSVCSLRKISPPALQKSSILTQS